MNSIPKLESNSALDLLPVSKKRPWTHLTGGSQKEPIFVGAWTQRQHKGSIQKVAMHNNGSQSQLRCRQPNRGLRDMSPWVPSFRGTERTRTNPDLQVTPSIPP